MRGGTATTEQSREQKAAQQAADLIVFADGIEAAAGITAGETQLAYDEDGRVIYARKLRALARETLWLVQALEAERSARQQIQTDRDRCLQILANQAAEAIDAEEDLPF